MYRPILCRAEACDEASARHVPSAEPDRLAHASFDVHSLAGAVIRPPVEARIPERKPCVYPFGVKTARP